MMKSETEVKQEQTSQVLHGSGTVIRKKTRTGKNLYLILLARWGNHWSFPKGHIEKNENPLVCALRETLEETGISQDLLQMEEVQPVEIAYKLNQKTKKVKDGIKRVKLFFFFLKREKSVILSKEHTNFKWASMKECQRLLRPELAEAVTILQDSLSED
ncbi:MAG: NUDIX domain-containing protein [Flavobacteriaceae bacterium]|nr:NUDIX domain-containing protein [Flavobacteriaceae bacterium]